MLVADLAWAQWGNAVVFFEVEVGVGFRWFSRLLCSNCGELLIAPFPHTAEPATHCCNIHHTPYTPTHTARGGVSCYGEIQGLGAARRAVANVAVITYMITHLCWTGEESWSTS